MMMHISNVWEISSLKQPYNNGKNGSEKRIKQLKEDLKNADW